MKAVHNPNTTHVLGPPPDWDREKPCSGLPVTKFDGMTISYWRLSWRERLAVLCGRTVRLCIVGERHPAVSLDVSSN